MDYNQRSFKTSSKSIFFTYNNQSIYISTWFNKGNRIIRKLGKIPICSTLLTIYRSFVSPVLKVTPYGINQGMIILVIRLRQFNTKRPFY